MTIAIRHAATRLLTVATVLAAALALPPSAKAVSFALESTTVILQERDGQTAFNITNEGDRPLLLLTGLDDLGGPPMAGKILIAPPITRIDPGQSQQVNFILKQGPPLRHEVMLKVSFEGITPQTGGSTLIMPVRQEIAFLIQPAALPPSRTPWQDLKLSLDRDALVLRNPGQHVIRLGRDLRLRPGDTPANLGQAWLMPGETRRVPVKQRPRAVGIVPLSRYGLALPGITLPVSGAGP
ncbi:fimbria/pilus periplasmic chaperone [Achromobacter sp. Marseille-Q0513]|uniref:fimbria/pilus chaperone family protein n=1 Tax=Achromobacter sp. Marseille-Q0513 TaxID=2829161 RepID=UPI001B8FC8BF|nr:fimbria/pilus chaperone family protein [Achromobacter sp. Marseille-Q0513]MBR8655921.1 fimbria/pilus periplasmic chaperone [Achromobacter sp. Marseille-Q0513]